MFLEAKKFFKEFISKYDLTKDKEKINSYYYKYYHTYDVVKWSKKLFSECSLSNEDKEIALTIAIFHDLGRFYQFEKYSKYNDYKTNFDHAKSSVEILLENNWFIKNNINEETKNIICYSIYNHNKIDIPKHNARFMMFLKLIRDADKLSILNTMKFDEIKKESLSKIILDAFKQEKLINNKLKKTIADDVLYHFAFIFDLNYEKSYKLIKQYNIDIKYLDLIKKGASELEFETIKKIIENYIEKRMNNVR